MTVSSPPFKYASAFGGRSRLILLDVSFLEEPGAFQHFLSQLSPSRQKKVGRFRVRESALESLGAGLVLDQGLLKIGLREREALLTLGEQGKPYLRHDPPYYFNLSHSGRQVLGIFSEEEVGCDIQEENSHWRGISARFFHPREVDYISSQAGEEGQRQAFFRLWALKESYIKATGKGLSTDLTSFCIRLDTEKPSLDLPPEEAKISPAKCLLEEFSFPGLKGYHLAGCLLSR